MSDAELLAVFGSVTLPDGVTVAVSAIEPLADVPIVPVALYTIFAAAGMFTVSLIFPEPLAVNPVAPPFGVAVNVTPVKLAGKVSWIMAPDTSLGPAFVTTIVYVFFDPGTALLFPSLTVIFKSALTVIVSESVAVLFAVLGSGA